MITDTPEVVEVPLQEVIVAAGLAQPRNDVSNDVTNDATDDVSDDVSDGLAASLPRGNASSGDDVAKSPCIDDRNSLTIEEAVDSITQDWTMVMVLVFLYAGVWSAAMTVEPALKDGVTQPVHDVTTDVIKEQKQLTVEEAVEDITEHWTWLLFMVFIYSIMWSAVGATCAYMPVFAGVIPYTEWRCTSDQCHQAESEYNLTNTNSTGSFYTKSNLCSNNLTVYQDFVWTSERSSFAVDWDIYCDNEYLHPFISSFYFVGALVGLIGGMGVYDTLGRRRGAAVGALICTIGTFLGAFCKWYWLMIVIRFLQGFGNFMAYSGMYIWVLEFSPERLRVYVNMVSMILWAAGYCVIVLVAYFVTNWNYMLLVLAFYGLVCIPPLLFFPESPRYLLARGYDEEAKQSLHSFSQLSSTKVSYLNVVLVKNEVVEKEGRSFKRQMKDFVQFRSLTLETLLQFYLWFVCAGLFYGFNFSWSAIGKNIYTSYLFASLGEIIAYVLMVPLILYTGRRISMMALCVGASACYLVAMFEVPFGGEWSLDRLASILGTMFVSAAFGLIYLYTGELAPTTHRGMILSGCSIVARFGSYAGPYVSLLFSSSRLYPLILFAVLAAGAALACLVLPDTSGIAVPETAEAVQKRRQDNGWIGAFRIKTNYQKVAEEGEC